MPFGSFSRLAESPVELTSQENLVKDASIHYAVEIHMAKTGPAVVCSAVGRDSFQHLCAGEVGVGVDDDGLVRSHFHPRHLPGILGHPSTSWFLLHVENDYPPSQMTTTGLLTSNHRKQVS